MATSTGAPEIGVALYLSGNFRPEALGDLFDVVPNIAVVKGAARRRKSTGELVGTYGESWWGFSSEQTVGSNQIDEHVLWLIAKSGSASAFVRANLGVSAFIEVTLREASSCVLPRSLVEFALSLNADIGIVASRPYAA